VHSGACGTAGGIASAKHMLVPELDLERSFLHEQSCVVTLRRLDPSPALARPLTCQGLFCCPKHRAVVAMLYRIGGPDSEATNFSGGLIPSSDGR
jgi:hypothetical protein